MLESEFQSKLIKELECLFDGCIILKNDPSYIQGFPDLLILYNNQWATLECKNSRRAKTRPNQHHYVELLDDMSFSRFVYPENKEEVLYELQKSFSTRGTTCVPKCK